MYTKPKVKSNCTFVVQQMISSFGNQYHSWWAVSSTFYICSEQYFPSQWIYFYLSWSRHYYTIIISALLSRMGGAVWHYDGSELSSVISVLIQRSSRTSEVQVYCHCIQCVWETIATTKEHCYDCDILLEKLFFCTVRIYIHLFTHQCRTKWFLCSSSNRGNCLHSKLRKKRRAAFKRQPQLCMYVDSPCERI